jgi:G3E family GTPase
VPDAAIHRVPVDLITGFLGSGKTTLLRRLLADPALADTAVLINEFGEIGLDHLLLERIDETVVLLQSGCLCCSIRAELADAVKDLLSRRERGAVPRFRRVIVESTGIADPFPILSTLHAEPVLRHHVRVGAVITTVDALNGRHQLARHFESVKQVAAADRIVVTKTDLADAAEVARLETTIRQINPDIAILSAKDDPFDATDLLSQEPGRKRTALSPSGESDAPVIALGHRHTDVHAFAITVDRPLDWTTFGLWLGMLLHRHGDDILRVKGILNVTGSDRPVALHGVQRLVYPPRHMRAWHGADRRSRIVFIVRGLSRSLIERSLNAFDALNGSIKT